ncbi:MAG: extracellular solute-binding protein [Verrucomicrobia bacterium]|nr:extracellular solute-binding protein [Verrucomicrobiota bacterium]
MLLTRLKKYFALLVIAAVYLWSVVAIAVYRGAESEAGTITLRIGHWQLEASVREALNQKAAAYSALRQARGLQPVRIIQDAIPESIYAQWTTTQLMGGTAPDILELGHGSLPYHLWLQYYNRYMLPLTDYVSQPNPYNAGTDMDGLPLRDTFKDGMRSSYIEEMQEFINIPLSQFGVRIFYNRDLLRELTGLETPPAEYRAFLQVCADIGAKLDSAGKPYVAIAGSQYHIGMWEGPMFDPLTYTVKDIADFNRDGFVDNGEQYAAFQAGRLSFEHPAIRARFKMLQEVTDHFQVGYTGLGRDEAVFLFAQQRAVFMTTGTWDARSLLEQAEGTFAVGVMDYPIPTADDPEYGVVIKGPNYERIGGGFPFGITRTSNHPDVALDFLLYLAGQQINGELNEIIGWIPSVRGAPTPSFLKGFEPHLWGVYGCFNPSNLGGETWDRWTKLYSAFQVREATYEDIVTAFEPFYKERGLADFLEQQKDWRRAMHTHEQFLAGIRAQAIAAGHDGNANAWVKYRALTTERQIWPEIHHARQLKLVTGELALPPSGPYEYSDAVLERVRTKLKERNDA